MKRAAVAVILSVALVSTVGARQQLPAVASVQVFRSATNLVPLNVTVTDTRKNFVKGLTAADFAILEDGVAQEVQFFEAADVPIDLILLIDTSSSMSDKMDVVHEAAIGFLKTLKPGDRGAVVAFADGVDVVQPLTSDREALDAAVRKTAARGATSLHNALYISLKQFARGAKQDTDVRRQAIAVLSDGDDTSSLVSFDDVLEVARRSGVGVYPISLQSKYAAAKLAAAGMRRTFSQAEYSLRVLAQDTGGQAFFPNQIEELKDVYSAIASELSSQYCLAYAPADNRADGKFRRITVRVEGRPELKLRTRTGYTAALTRAAAGPSSYHQQPR